MVTQQEPTELETLIESQPTQEEWTDYLNRQDIPDVAPPGDQLQQGSVTSPPTEDNPAGVSISRLEFNGYVEIWNTKTGFKYEVPRYLLWQYMPLTFPDGSRVYSTSDPRIPPRYGDNLCCHLHRKSPMFDRLIGMGFRECFKEHIPNRDARDRHMSSSHKNCHRFLEQDKIETAREEERTMHREMMKAMSEAAVRGLNPAATATLETPINPPSRANLFSATCPDCDKEFNGKSRKQAQQRVGLHHRNCPNKS